MPINIDRPDLKPSDEQRRSLGIRLRRMYDEAVEYKGNWEEFSAENWRQYLCKPDQAVKTWPWKDASNFFAPMTRVIVDALAAQYYDAMFGSKPRVIGQRPEDDPIARDLDNFYFDYVWQTVLKLPYLANDWLLQNLIDGTSVVLNRWTRDFRVRRFDVSRQEPVIRKERFEYLGTEIEASEITGVNVDVTERAEIFQEERPEVRIVDLNDFFWAPGSGSSVQFPECPWFIHRVWWSEEDLLQRRREGFWGLTDLDALRAKLGERIITDAGRLKLDQQEATYRTTPVLEVLVFYMRLALPGTFRLEDRDHEQTFDAEDGYSEEVAVWYMPEHPEDADRVLMIKPIYRLRPDGKRPVADNRYTRIPDHPYGLGIPFKLRQLNKLMNSAVNQMMDYGTLQNIPFFFYEPQVTGLLSDLSTIQPGQGIPVARAAGVTFPRLQGNPAFWQAVQQISQMWAERETSVTDFTQGRAASVPNAPRTYRGMAMMIQQSGQFFSYMVQLQAEAYAELFRQVHALYKKFFPPEQEIRFFNQRKGIFDRLQMTSAHFAEDIDFAFQLNPNRNADTQTALTIFQLFSPLLMQQGNMAGVRTLAKEVYETMGKKNFDQIWPEAPPPQLGMPGMPGAAPGPGVPQPAPPVRPNGGMQQQLAPLAPIPNPQGGL